MGKGAGVSIWEVKTVNTNGGVEINEGVRSENSGYLSQKLLIIL